MASSKYKKKYCKLLVDHMAQGGSFKGFAGHPDVMVGRTTLYAWLQAHDEFADAKERGDMASLYFWEERGKAGTLGALLYTAKETIKPDGNIVREKKRASFNAYAYALMMRNMHGWSLSEPEGSKGELSPELTEALNELELEESEIDAKPAKTAKKISKTAKKVTKKTTKTVAKTSKKAAK